METGFILFINQFYWQRGKMVRALGRANKAVTAHATVYI
jgi:hypothetical protein